MSQPIHTVEPTLVDEAGHCHAFLGAVCTHGPDERFEVWAGHAVDTTLYGDMPQVHLHPYFRRLPRRIQAWWLYSRLIRKDVRIFVPTAGANDLSLLDLAAFGRPVRKARVTMFFHWIRPSRSKRMRMALVARHQPEMLVTGGTEEIVGILDDVGFKRTRLVPYPVTTRARPAEGPAKFRYLLFAGAARIDKGFEQVVDLVTLLNEKASDIPVSVQTSGKHYGKQDGAVGLQVERLQRVAYPALQTSPSTLDTEAYLEQFHGAICLQPYDRNEFAGRVSAVTVDALASGAPILTTSGTWIGRTVQRYDAGLVLDDLAAPAMSDAVDQLIARYDEYSANAREAARRIQDEHSGAHLLAAVRDA